MKKMLSAVLAVVVIIGAFSVPAFAANEANHTVADVIVNGETLSFHAYEINNNTYFKLRDIAYILNGTEKQFEVSWDNKANTVALASGKPYTAVGSEMARKSNGAQAPVPAGSKILIDGTAVSFTAYLIDGNNYFRLNDIGAAFDFGVSWNKAIVIDTGKRYNEQDALFIFGFDSRKSQPKTVDGFLTVFVDQFKRYNQAALEIWPGNRLYNVPIIIDDTDTGRMWLIEPDGAVTPISEEEAKEKGLAARRSVPFAVGAFGDFYVYDDKGNIISQYFTAEKLKGIYFSVSEGAMENIDRWGNWAHVSTFDVIRFGIHESFHTYEQSKWQEQPVAERANYVTKDQFFEATGARIKRDLLLRQLMAAVSQMGEKRLVLDVLATYEDYKKQFPEDFSNALYWDRVEGTANYVEYLSSMYSYFPEQIKSKDDVYHALSQLATIEKYHRRPCGVIDEAYEIGSFAGILLDMLGIDWKNQLMNDPMLTPMEILSLNFKNEVLPGPRQPTQAEIDEVMAKRRDRKDGIIKTLEAALIEYEKKLETAPEEEREGIENTISNYKNRIQELRE